MKMKNLSIILLFVFSFSGYSQTRSQMEIMHLQELKRLKEKNREEIEIIQKYIYGTRDYINSYIKYAHDFITKDEYISLVEGEKIMWRKVEFKLDLYNRDFKKFYQNSISEVENYRQVMESKIKSKLPSLSSCSEILNTVKNHAKLLSTISDNEMNSDWLKRVSLFIDEKGKQYVVAVMFSDGKLREYVFCSINGKIWNSFVYGSVGISSSYGKRFVDNIMSNICNCN